MKRFGAFKQDSAVRSKYANTLRPLVSTHLLKTLGVSDSPNGRVWYSS